MDDPFSRPVPARSFPCPRSVACIIVMSVSRPDYLRWASINFSLRQRGRCRHPHALAQCSPARSSGMGIVTTAPLVNFKIRWLKMMSVPESRTAVGRHDGINGRDSQPQSLVISPGQSVLQGTSCQTDHPACPPLRRRELLARMNNGLTELLGRQALGFR